ncbi:TniQ protein [Sporomusa acidovorans]|nr:TnsD family Tn7-like transposition protein [Sporomusa acidovorans]OZC18944.1 hypothetical protein SPACI_30300 [Sporomusa acidovorans DSM 3132]SDD69895.1 TniQ protein [Sporomusa acidovorans]
MLGFFPTPYPDELLYSIIARFRVRAAIVSPKMVMEEIFNSRTAAAIVDLPCNLVGLCLNFPIGSKVTPEYLIDKHTLFPIYEPFANQDIARKVYNAMLGSYGGNIHNLFGLLASAVKHPDYLRFCPLCLREEQDKFGEGYWHRLHQIPGVEVCLTHQSILHDSYVKVCKFNKHEFISASDMNCVPKPVEFEYSQKMFNELVGIARDIEWILNNKIMIKNLVWLQEQYIYSLITKKLATAMGRVYQANFIKAFRQYYGDDLLKKLQSTVDENKEGWLSELVRKPRKSFHPLRHILLIRFLSGSVPCFLAQNHTIKPFGDGPWPCLNAAADHYHHNVIKNIEITYCHDTKLPVGTFSCSCGFVYSRRGPDSSPDNRYKIGRIKSFGSVWKEKLKILAQQELSARNIARMLKVDTKTVQKYSNSETHLNSCSNLELEQDISSRKKDEWIKLCEQYSDESVTFLRKLKPSLYTWLYRHEREWIFNNSSQINRKRKSHNQRVNWEERDAQICKKIRQEVTKILSADGKPMRISVSFLGKRLGILSFLEKKINKLPQTKEYLRLAVENIEDYQKRRIIWAVKVLYNENKSIVAWRVKRKAGLGKVSMEINNFIEKIIDGLIIDEVIYK